MAPRPGGRKVWPILVAVAVGVLVVAAAVTLPFVLAGDDTDERASEELEAALEDVPDNLDAVQAYDDLDPTHVTGDVDYEQSPPVGGNHHATWLECGIYDQPVPEENVVHDLEHGTIWITYRGDDLTEDDIAMLAEALPDNGILSPYPDQDAPVVVTVWGRQLDLVAAQDPRLVLFIEEFGGGVTAPEPFASCHGGTAEPRPAGG